MDAHAAPPGRLSGPLWRQVLALALPALAQQYLHLVVQLSDQFLAGRFELPDPRQRTGYLSALTTAGYRDVTVGPAAPELPEGAARDRSGHWGRLAAYHVARGLPGGAASPLAFNLQAYGRRS